MVTCLHFLLYPLFLTLYTVQSQFVPTATLALNAPSASAYAFLPYAGIDHNITARFDFQTQSNGSCRVMLSSSGYAKNTSFPVRWFLSQQAVPKNGDCYLAGPVLDPAGADDFCNTLYPAACKVGDLAGKSHNITHNSTGADFLDNFLSFSKNSSNYFLKSALVLQDSNGTRIACTNITTVSSGNGTARSNLTLAPITYAQVHNLSTQDEGRPERNATGQASASMQLKVSLLLLCIALIL